jgi:hypothetical protein
MMRAASLVAVLVAVPAWGDPAGNGSSLDTAAHPYGILGHPIDLSTGFHPPQMPSAGEDSSLAVPREREWENPSLAEFSARPFGLTRPGIPGVNKRQHVPTFRLRGVTLFGGSIAGSADGRSARVFLTWPPEH